MNSKVMYGITLLVFLLGLFCTAGIYKIESRYMLQRDKLDVYETTLSSVLRLESLINANLVVARVLRAEVEFHRGFDIFELDRLADQILVDDLQIRHIALAPDLIVKYVFPRKGNESAIGLDYRENAEQRAAVMQAIQRKDIILAGPVKLVQGGQALIARVPVFLDEAQEQAWGIIAVVIEYEKLFYNAGITQLASTYRIGIRRLASLGLEGQAVYGDQSVFDEKAVSLTIPLPSGAWQVAVLPLQGWQIPLVVSLEIFIIGLGLSLLLSWIVYLLLRNRVSQNEHVEELKVQASHDHLTGLPNRLQLTRYLQRITHKHDDDEGEVPFCVIFIDVDNFKEINDSLGHNLGDELLVSMALRLERCLRPADFLARLGGDEFVVVLTGMCDPGQSELWAKKLILELSTGFVVGSHDLNITVSLGLAFYPQDGIDPTTLLQHADRAMYAAKESGKNTFHFFNRSLRLQADKHVEIYQDMITGLDDNEFEVFFQPIMDINSGEFPRCEALLRWNHPEKGWISPIEFIPIAEKTGFIRQLGLWVLDRVCQHMVTLREQGLLVNVAVNRSTNEFRDVATLQQWLPIVHSYQLQAKDFTFEITESLLMTEDNHHLDKIRLVKSQGFILAIDDFGTGYSGINYLRQYPVDMVKIDKSFVANLLESEQDRTLFDVLIKMAKTLGLQLVIEGVEVKEQLSMIREKECEFGQGFYMARPMPFAEFQQFLKAESQVKSV